MVKYKYLTEQHNKQNAHTCFVVIFTLRKYINKQWTSR